MSDAANNKEQRAHAGEEDVLAAIARTDEMSAEPGAAAVEPEAAVAESEPGRSVSAADPEPAAAESTPVPASSTACADAPQRCRARVTALVCVLLLALLAVGAARQTLSAGSRSAIAQNRATFGGIDARVIETMPGPSGTEVPATTIDIPVGDFGKVDRTVRVENAGSHPAYIRVRLDFVGETPEGEHIPLDDCITYQLATEGWTERDGWYYHDAALEGGERTPALITGMVIDAASARAAAPGAELKLHVVGQGVQVENNATTAIDAEGWPEEGGERR